MTDSEMLLWSKIRGKQLKGLQFYRQKIIGNYIADFYCPKARLVIEMEQDMIRKSLLTSPHPGTGLCQREESYPSRVNHLLLVARGEIKGLYSLTSTKTIFFMLINNG